MDQSYKKTLCENIDRVAQHDISTGKIFGCAYFVYQNGDTIERCYGTQSPDSDIPITNTTVFRLASMTKPITSVAAMMLVERGLLSLEDTVDRFLPEFKSIKIIAPSGNVSTPQKLPTVKNILTHSSGFASSAKKSRRITAADRETLDSTIKFYLNSGLDFEPGSMQAYSGVGAFDVLAKIVEIVSETDFLTFLTKEIFEPCEMYHTTFIPSCDQRKQMVQMHHRKNGESIASPMPDNCVFESFPCTHYLGGAGLVSTLHDYCNFAKMLLHYGQAENKRILSEESVRAICAPHFYKRQTEAWGLGVRVITDEAYPYLPKGSFGWSGAYGSHFWIDHSNHLFAVFMKNSRIDGGAGNESAKNFERAVYSPLITE